MKTITQFRLTALLLVYFLTLNSCSIEPRVRLTMSILTEQREYRMGDTLRLETRFTNSGTQSFYLLDELCWNPGKLLNIHAFNASGKEAFGHSDFLRDCVPPPPSRDHTSRFIELEPSSFEGFAEKFDVRELVPEPGEYDLVVKYKSAISKKWISEYGGPKLAALTIWTSEYPELTSNRLHITVNP